MSCLNIRVPGVGALIENTLLDVLSGCATLARAALHASTRATPETAAMARSMESGVAARASRTERSNCCAPNNRSTAPRTDCLRFSAPMYTAPPVARVSNVSIMRCRLRNALRSESSNGRDTPLIPANIRVTPSTRADAPPTPMPTSRNASPTEIRQPRQTGIVAATMGKTMPTASCHT